MPHIGFSRVQICFESIYKCEKQISIVPGFFYYYFLLIFSVAVVRWICQKPYGGGVCNASNDMDVYRCKQCKAAKPCLPELTIFQVCNRCLQCQQWLACVHCKQCQAAKPYLPELTKYQVCNRCTAANTCSRVLCTQKLRSS